LIRPAALIEFRLVTNAETQALVDSYKYTALAQRRIDLPVKTDGDVAAIVVKIKLSELYSAYWHELYLYLKRRVVNVSCSSAACDWTTEKKSC